MHWVAEPLTLWLQQRGIHAKTDTARAKKSLASHLNPGIANLTKG